MRLVQGMPSASRCLLRDQFRSYKETSDAGGIVVASTISNGISPTGASGRVTYNGTEALLINATQATFVLRFKMFSVNNPAVTKSLIAKAPQALNDNQFFMQIEPNRLLNTIVCATAGDFANGAYLSAALVLGAEYVMHIVYNGALAAASRVLYYIAGAFSGTASYGTTPASMRVSAVPLTILNRHLAAAAAPDDLLLREFRVHDRAFSAEEVADDYANITYSEVL